MEISYKRRLTQRVAKAELRKRAKRWKNPEQWISEWGGAGYAGDGKYAEEFESLAEAIMALLRPLYSRMLPRDLIMVAQEAARSAVSKLLAEEIATQGLLESWAAHVPEKKSKSRKIRPMRTRSQSRGDIRTEYPEEKSDSNYLNR